MFNTGNGKFQMQLFFDTSVIKLILDHFFGLKIILVFFF